MDACSLGRRWQRMIGVGGGGANTDGNVMGDEVMRQQAGSVRSSIAEVLWRWVSTVLEQLAGGQMLE